MKEAPLNRLKEHIIRPISEEDLIPLLLFLGGQTFERVRALLNMLCGFMEVEALTKTECLKISRCAFDFNHLCGIHSKLESMSLDGFVSRLLKSQSVLRKIPHLYDFTNELAKTCFIFPLTPISRYARRSRQDWRNLNGERDVYKYAKQPFVDQDNTEIPEFYPFVTGEPQKEHELLIAVHNAVPSYIPKSHRDDICQDLIVNVLEGKIKITNLPDEVPKFIRAAFKAFPTKYGPLYLEDELRHDGVEGFTLLDILHDGNIRQRW